MKLPFHLGILLFALIWNHNYSYGTDKHITGRIIAKLEKKTPPHEIEALLKSYGVKTESYYNFNEIDHIVNNEPEIHLLEQSDESETASWFELAVPPGQEKRWISVLDANPIISKTWQRKRQRSRSPETEKKLNELVVITQAGIDIQKHSTTTALEQLRQLYPKNEIQKVVAVENYIKLILYHYKNPDHFSKYWNALTIEIIARGEDGINLHIPGGKYSAGIRPPRQLHLYTENLQPDFAQSIIWFQNRVAEQLSTTDEE